MSRSVRGVPSVTGQSRLTASRTRRSEANVRRALRSGVRAGESRAAALDSEAAADPGLCAVWASCTSSSSVGAYGSAARGSHPKGTRPPGCALCPASPAPGAAEPRSSPPAPGAPRSPEERRGPRRRPGGRCGAALRVTVSASARRTCAAALPGPLGICAKCGPSRLLEPGGTTSPIRLTQQEPQRLPLTASPGRRGTGLWIVAESNCAKRRRGTRPASPRHDRGERPCPESELAGNPGPQDRAVSLRANSSGLSEPRFESRRPGMNGRWCTLITCELLRSLRPGPHHGSQACNRPNVVIR